MTSGNDRLKWCTCYCTLRQCSQRAANEAQVLRYYMTFCSVKFYSRKSTKSKKYVTRFYFQVFHVKTKVYSHSCENIYSQLSKQA